MDKNVGSVDIDELKKAREELNRERGIETDPNMYSNYNPNRDKSDENLSSADSLDDSLVDENVQSSIAEEISFTEEDSSSVSNSEKSDDFSIEELEAVLTGESVDSSEKETEVSEIEDDGEPDFSAYDNFSAFEVTDNNNSHINESESIEENFDAEENVSAAESMQDEDDAFGELNELLGLSTDTDDSEDEEDSIEELVSEVEENKPEENVNIESEESEQEEVEDDPLEEEKIETEEIGLMEDSEETPEEIVAVEDELEPDINLDGDFAPVFEAGELVGLQEHLIAENTPEPSPAATQVEDPFDGELEIIDNYKKLGRLEDLLNEEEEVVEEEPEEEIEEEVSHYENIDEFNFVDVISTDEFRNSDRLSYVLGKNESGEAVFGNLRDYYNMVVFGKQTDQVHDLIHSILLSLVVKNAINEVNFVICDSKADSKFEIYNKSSYMYFNKLAKTNKEILDTLIEVTKELEARYELLASVGVKSIEQYNTIAKNDNMKTLPYVVTVFNNYSKAIQLSESDKINACLTQILKFGRIVGLYLIIVANAPINSEEINYNLPTRISFKSDDKSRSFATLGFAGAENLPQGGDFLCATVEVEGMMHLKVANISRPEIEVLIENIED